MKIVVLPGVGTNDIKPSHKYFLDKVTKGLSCEGEIFMWEHGHQHPQSTLPLKKTRDFVCEVILDFQQAVVHALDMKVPEADIYIGHSAGSILALVQNKPTVIFGSPAALVELIDESSGNAVDIFNGIMRENTNNVLNIINEYDVIAYPLQGVNIENYEYSGKIFSPLTYFPVNAHTHYWTCDRVIEKIIKTIKLWNGIVV